MSSQLQVSGEAKIRDIQGPVVANSGVITALDGAASQYVRGDGTLADFPTSSGGGSSVSYYLNSSVSQGTIGGVAYRELSKDPIIGAGTDIPISANGYVANYITDVNDPDVVLVPGGNFNCELYFSVNNNTGNPTTYAELYKYDGTTFTLLGTSAGVPESINQGTTIAPYYFAIPVATAALSVTDRLAIRIYVNVDGRTVTLHTENGHLCQVVTTLSKGMVSLNNLTDQSQYLATGTSGTNFAIVSSGDTHTFNLPVASATNTGKLSSTDWSTFNGKQPAGNYVTLDTTQTITAEKTFSNLIEFNDFVLMDIGVSLAKTSGTPLYGGANGYANLQLVNAASVNSLYLIDGDTSKYSKLSFNNAADYTYTFPNITGTLALLEGTQTFSGAKTFSLDILVNGLTIGRGAGSISTNTVVGSSALSANTTGYGNTSIGLNNLIANTTGFFNVAIGASSLISNTTGTYNAALGTSSLYNNTTGSNNTAVGQQAGETNTTGSNNTYIGKGSGYNITTGSNNTIIGAFNGTAALANNIVLADGAGNVRYRYDGTNNNLYGNVNFSSTIGNGTYTYTLPAATGTLALTSAIPANPVGGTGTTNTLPKFTGASTIGNSNITDTGSLITLGSNSLVNGRFGIGSSASIGNNFRVSGNITGTANPFALLLDGTIMTDATGVVQMVGTYTSTANSASVSAIYHFNAVQGVLGTGATITTQYGFVASGFTQATNNFGFYGNIASGTNRWNLYMNGTAANYLAGVLNIGTTTLSGFSLDVNGTARVSNALTLNGAYSNTSDVALIVNATIPAINLRTAASVGRFTIATNYSNTNRSSFLVGTAANNPSTEALFIEHSNGAATFSSSVTAGNNVTISSTTNASLVAATNSTTGYTFIDLINNGASGRNYQIGVGGNSAASGYANNLYFDLVGVGNVMTLTSGRNVGIGTNSPATALNVVAGTGGASGRIRLTHATSGAQIDTYVGVSDGVGFIVNNNPLFFETNNTERMRITSGGNVGIGTTSAPLQLTVNQAAYVKQFVVFGTTSDNKYIGQGDQISGAFGAGDLSIANYATSARVIVITNTGAGVQLANNATSWSAWSDERLKNNIENLNSVIPNLMSLRTVKYNLITDKQNEAKRLGLIAQDLIGKFDEVLDYASYNAEKNEQYYSVKYTEMIPVLVKAIQEQQAQIEELKALINK